MSNLKKISSINKFAIGWVYGALAALVVVVLMSVLAPVARAADDPYDKLHPGDLTGTAVPVTIVCTSPKVLLDILSAPDLKTMYALGELAGKHGYCTSLPAPVIVMLDEGVGYAIVGPHEGVPQVVRATVYRIRRKDGNSEHPEQFYVYSAEVLQES